MKHTISVLVENTSGVLSRITGLFSRRGFNIDSLAVGITDDPAISRVTIVADGDEHTVEQLEKQLNKLIDVIKVKSFNPDEMISRELVLVKVNCSSDQQRSEIMNIVSLTDAKIVDITPSTVTIEISDWAVKLRNFEDLIRPYGILEMVRTGVVAIQRGAKEITEKKKK
ncbi:MAG: acetolactate synthase small subunit [Ruminococcus sp.]|nr:acetolactate synthase small subunit [Ruminococcus sp.]